MNNDELEIEKRKLRLKVVELQYGFHFTIA